MKKILKTIAGLTFLVSLTFSCSDSKSLQKFIVDEQEDNTMISFDLPASLLSINEEMQTPENLKTLHSIKKANVLLFKIEPGNKEKYLAKKQELKSILKQDKYTELMRVGNNKRGAKIQMIGNSDTIDELIIFANDDDTGWALIRVLGNDMQPDKIMTLLQTSEFDTNNANFSLIKDVLTKKRDK